MSPRSVAVVIAVTLLLAGVAPAAGLDSEAQGPNVQSGGAQALSASVAPHNSSLEPGDVELRIELDAEGDAHWRVKTAVAVRNADERDAFEELVDQFNRSDSPLGLATFEATAANVSRTTGRNMNIENVERHHARHNETGALWITFTWTNFGRTTRDRISVDDAFNTTSGVWLPSLSETETLVVVPPSGYGVSSAPTGSNAAPTSLSDGVARWEGPRDFEQRGPWVVYSGDSGTRPTLTANGTSSGPTDDGPTNGGPTTGTTAPGGTDEADGLPAALPLIVVAAAVGALVLVAYTRREEEGDGLGAVIGGASDGDGGASAESAADPDTGGDGVHDAAETSDDGHPTDAASSESTAAGAAAGATAGQAAESGGEADDVADAEGEEGTDDGIDEALLSDEERVERLIERNGGRMKQAAIVQETGWSNAKVSQLLSSMDEDDRIDKLRIGRENLISFPDEDVADLDSE